MRRDGAILRASAPALGAALLALLVFSAWLSARRVYQIDECYAARMERQLADGSWRRFQTDPGALFLALSRVAGSAPDSRETFARSRRAMLALFWLNLVLLAAAAGEKADLGGTTALVCAATLAPLWDYGLEMRHDNLLLCAILLTWLVLRARPGGRPAYFAAGACAVVGQLAAFKAFVFLIPISAAFLIFPPPEHRASRLALSAWWAAGAASALAAGWALYARLGLWSAYLTDMRGMLHAAASVRRMLPWEASGRILWEAPVLAVLTAAALRLEARDFREKSPTSVWDGARPEAALTLLALAEFAADPTPYAYNLIYLCSFAFLLVWRSAPALLREHRARLDAGKPSRRALMAAHAAAFVAALGWAALWTNARQTALMDAAESLTGPDDPVLDGAGLVPARPAPTRDWLMDTLNIARWRDPARAPLRELWAKDPAPVFIADYRTDWLAAADREFLERRYAAISDDFRVLAASLPPGGGDFDVPRAGRYLIAGPRDCAGAALDARPLSSNPVVLAAGSHRWSAPAACRAAALWVGPRRDDLPRLGPGDHRRVFVDWY